MAWIWLTVLTTLAGAAALELDERPEAPNEWGYRPADGETCEVNPPGFSWRPTAGAVTYELELAGAAGFDRPVYRAEQIEFSVHCGPATLPAGDYTWRYRAVDKDGGRTAWSQVRRFTMPADAAAMPLPPRAELLGRVPRTHPRLFMRPEQVGRLRELAGGALKPEFERLQTNCERWLQNPPPTAEPPKYPDGMVSGSDEWQKIWWGNRTYTINVLNAAATLAFTRLLGGREEYGQEARRLLLECAKWDPRGATGYRYNDEAGMPYNYGFARTYTFVHDLLTETERETCRQVMRVRGEEMYRHLCPRHLWQPYSSHSNRAWHKLGELGIAFLGEIEGAADWLWFAVNVFHCAYPVWSDADGGWHEGSSYWASYIDRFTWWADVQKAALGLDAFDKPYFSRIGYYPLYLMPPNMRDGGFGDLCENKKSTDFLSLMSGLTAQAGNGHWQWWLEANGGVRAKDGYVGFIRGALPEVKATPPTDLPTSRVFRGTGQAVLNHRLDDANENVQLVFKSSPFGTQSHGYEANNSFLLWAYGQRLLIRTGRRDNYGSEHHKNWMWSTRSVNNITVDGVGQLAHSPAARGEITAFETTPTVDLVQGECGATYRVDGRPILDGFRRSVIFLKPEAIVVYDRLTAPAEHRYEYWLHALNEIAVPDQRNLLVTAGDVLCDIDFLAPAGLTFRQTDQYDPNPRPRVTTREWHLTATTAPARAMDFVVVLRPRKAITPAAAKATLAKAGGGWTLTVPLADGAARVELDGARIKVVRGAATVTVGN